jgi:hypothetical protein
MRKDDGARTLMMTVMRDSGPGKVQGASQHAIQEIGRRAADHLRERDGLNG